MPEFDNGGIGKLHVDLQLHIAAGANHLRYRRHLFLWLGTLASACHAKSPVPADLKCRGIIGSQAPGGRGHHILGAQLSAHKGARY